jgi:hypothetical protein
MFWLCTLFDPILDSFDVSMITVFHPKHSPMPLHIQMIMVNFLQSLHTHQHWCFHPPPSLPLLHCNLETDTQTWLYTFRNIPSLAIH